MTAIEASIEVNRSINGLSTVIASTLFNVSTASGRDSGKRIAGKSCLPVMRIGFPVAVRISISYLSTASCSSIGVLPMAGNDDNRLSSTRLLNGGRGGGGSLLTIESVFGDSSDDSVEGVGDVRRGGSGGVIIVSCVVCCSI